MSTQTDWVSEPPPPAGEAVQGHSQHATDRSRREGAAADAARRADPHLSGLRARWLRQYGSRVAHHTGRGGEGCGELARVIAADPHGHQQHGAVRLT